MINSYDVIVIGSGVSGLVASNYLCAAGYKVVLIEQHYAIGGCCSYFRRKGFTFDCGAHSLGSFRKGGQLSRIFSELDISTNGLLGRSEISDTIITNQGVYNFYSDLGKTIKELSAAFTDDAEGIGKIFEIISDFDINDQTKYIRYYLRYGKETFSEFIERYIKSKYLCNLLYSFLGNSGLPADTLWSISGIAMFREFILDGGYYFKGGMETFVKLLSDKFVSRGGVLLLRKRVNQILADNNNVSGVLLSDGVIITAKVVVTTGSPFQTFNKMLDKYNSHPKVVDKLSLLQPSMSSVVCHFAVRSHVLKDYKWGRTVWYSSNNAFESSYKKAVSGGVDELADTVLVAVPSLYDKSLAPENCSAVYAFVAAAYRDREYWIKNKSTIGLNIMNKINDIIPGFSQAVIFHEVATPITIERYTLNDYGAMYGLASSEEQSKQNFFSGSDMGLKGLYGAGHWYTSGAGQGGTPMVAFSGRAVAHAVAKRLKPDSICVGSGLQ